MASLARERHNSGLKMHVEALADYQKWCMLFCESRNPSDIMHTDIDRVKQEIEDVKKAKKDQKDDVTDAKRKENIHRASYNYNARSNKGGFDSSNTANNNKKHSNGSYYDQRNNNRGY